MNGDLLLDATPNDDLEIEPEPDGEFEIEPEPANEPTSEPAAAIPDHVRTDRAGLELETVHRPLVEVLGPEFRIPLLTKFIPNPALRVAADQAGTYALGLAVEGPEGLQRADLALSTVRASLSAIWDHFEEPASIANALHKNITGTRAEWQERGKQAIQTVGGRIYTEQKRLDGIAQEERRKAQAAADKQARETAQREADAAAKAQAPAPVVEELKRQAATATAPPVAMTTSAPALRGSTPVTTWKARLIGTPGEDEPNPDMADLTAAQRLQFFEVLKAILDGRAPIGVVAIDWAYANKRAAADKSTFSIPGLEAFSVGSTRAKSSRSK